jgi:beta-phosphoglucomutase
VNGKPDPAIYHLAAKQIGVPAKLVVVIEDSVSGVKAAKSAGMACLAIAGDSRREVLRRAGANDVVPDFVGLTLERLRFLVTPPKSVRKPGELRTLVTAKSSVPL